MKHLIAPHVTETHNHPVVSRYVNTFIRGEQHTICLTFDEWLTEYERRVKYNKRSNLDILI